MSYTTTDSRGCNYEASTIEGALCHAVLMIYMGDKTRHQAREALKQGQPFTAVYGFKSVTIAPKEAGV